MRGYDNERLLKVFQYRVVKYDVSFHDFVQCGHDRVAGEEYGLRGDSFGQEVLHGPLCGSEMHICQNTGNLSICLFREGASVPTGSKSRLNVTHANAFQK